MAEQSQIQEFFFRQIKEILPAHLSLVDEVSDLLNISNDSAYRRIRGEKILSLDELSILCESFKLSIDSLIGLKSDTVTFHSYMLQKEKFLFEDYLRCIRDDMHKLDTKQLKEIAIIFNEIHFFEFIQVPEITAFKIFYWMKSLLDLDRVKDMKFSVRDIDQPAISGLCQDIAEMYCRMPSTELMTSEALCSYLKQIRYYHDAGYFESDQDVLILYGKLVEMTNHVRTQAEMGSKYIYGRKPVPGGGSFHLYFNDLQLSDNMIMVDYGGHGIVYITANLINLFYTTNQQFFDANHTWKRNLVRRSNLISGAAERDRNRYFNGLLDQISHEKGKLLRVAD